MDFTLFYDGPLPASKGRLEQRHDIRVALHPQLQELWQHRPLRDVDPPPSRTINGHSYSSIVHSKWNFRARLEILLLKPEPPGRIIRQGGDIDNRLKNLFDALTVPVDPSNIPKGWTPGPGQD